MIYSGFRKKMTRVVSTVLFCFIISNLIGCDAFVRKFTRKSKKERISREEMVLVPEEYKPTMTKEQMYRQYFLFWQSWQEELITSLTPMQSSTSPLQSSNNKKQVSCAQEAIKNLGSLRAMLNDGQQKKMDSYVDELKDLRDQIAGDFYGTNVSAYARRAERIKRGVMRDFSYNKVKKEMR